MTNQYTIRYRKLGQSFLRWKTLKNVVGDGVENTYRFFHLANDKIVFIPQDSEVEFMPNRQKVLEREMSKESGHAVQRA